MLLSVVIQLAVSTIAKNLFSRRILSQDWDIFLCFQSKSVTQVVEESPGEKDVAALVDGDDFLTSVTRPSGIP